MANPTPSSLLDNPSHSMLHNSYYNVKAFGAVGNGVSDDTAELQGAVDAAVATAGQVVLPPGRYIVSSPITITGDIRISGTLVAGGGLGTSIEGTVAGSLISKSSGVGNRVIIDDLQLINYHATGTCVSLTGTQAPAGVYRCGLSGHKGIVFDGDSHFNTVASNCRISRGGTTLAGSKGITLTNHQNVLSCDVTDFEYGVYWEGVGTNVFGGRYEVNVHGIYVTGIATGTISGVAMEGNDYGVTLFSVAGVTVTGCRLYSTAAAPSGQSIVGYNIVSTVNCALIGCFEGGQTTTAAYRISGGGQGVTLISCSSNEGVWDLGTSGEAQIINCAGIDDIIRLPVIATASLPAAATVQNGRAVIEDAGTGDRNLIIYAGGQRFRIDGGANV